MSRKTRIITKAEGIETVKWLEGKVDESIYNGE
jgi:hypothetical protein